MTQNNHKYEKLVNGLWVPDTDGVMEDLRANISSEGRYHAKIIRVEGDDEEFEFDNLCVYQGLIALLNLGFAGAAPIGNWYLGVFGANYTPVNTDTASSIIGNATEVTGYTGGARPGFSPPQATGAPTLTNTASPATFTFNANATVYGAFLISSATPGSGAGVLFSAAQFGAPKTVGSGDQLILSYTLNAASS